uniref:Uncharacterized protein n=1 Tax=Glossina brevipalpis TaxID=37001 RepID=A0A1A9WJP7_9MUSC
MYNARAEVPSMAANRNVDGEHTITDTPPPNHQCQQREQRQRYLDGVVENLFIVFSLYLFYGLTVQKGSEIITRALLAAFYSHSEANTIIQHQHQHQHQHHHRHHHGHQRSH